MMRAMPTASLRSLLLICIFRAAFACLASMQMTGNPILFSSVHSHVDVAPVSSPTRATCGACDLTNAAIVSGSDVTTPSRSIFPVAATAGAELPIAMADRDLIERKVERIVVKPNAIEVRLAAPNPNFEQVDGSRHPR